MDNACKAKATHIVGFIHNDRFVLSCEAHAEDWQHRGNGWWIAKLQGFSGNLDNMIADVLADNQRIGEARRAGELRTAYEYQLKRMRRIDEALATPEELTKAETE